VGASAEERQLVEVVELVWFPALASAMFGPIVEEREGVGRSSDRRERMGMVAFDMCQSFQTGKLVREQRVFGWKLPIVE